MWKFSSAYSFLVLLLCLHTIVLATDCTGLPSDSTLADSLQTLVSSEGGEGSATIIVGDGPYYTCQVQGTTMGTYQELSVIKTYTVDGDNDVRVRQFEMDCIEVGGNNVWNQRSSSLDPVSGSVDYMNIEVMTNCSECTDSAGNDHHCEACNSACNVGLMRCTGSSSSDCCVAFEDDGVCSPDLNCNEDNFVANEQNNYTCACGLSCDPGFTLNSTNCSCALSNICMAQPSLCNNGSCTLNSAPDNYTCDCTGTGYTGDNCTEQQFTSVSTITFDTSTTTSLPDSSTVKASSSTIRTSSAAGIQTTSLASTSTTVTTVTSLLITVELTPSASKAINEPSSSEFIAAIVITAVIGLLLLIVLIVVIVYLLYYYNAGRKGFQPMKNSPWADGNQCHTNPMYIDPEEVTAGVSINT